MKRVLIISPHFPPTNAADMQRVRLLLPYLQENGWHAEVLVVDAADVASPKDEWTARGLPASVTVHRVRALGLGWSRIPGLGTLTFRALGALRRRGDALLGRKAEGGKQKAESGKWRSEFDLVFFSTTQFGVHVLGPRWQRKFRVPFAMDYQDPWVSDYYRTHPQVKPPGGKFKYAVADWLNRRQEPRVLRECSGIISVSPAYPEQLQARYLWLKIEMLKEGEDKKLKAEMMKAETLKAEKRNEGERSQKSGVRSQEAVNEKLKTEMGKAENGKVVLPYLVLPFPGDERDLQRVKDEIVKQPIFNPNDGFQHWVYIGVVIPQMSLALRGIFQALAKQLAQQPEWRRTLRLHFIGTSYAAAGRGQKLVEPLAHEFGLADVVQESTDRIPYSQTLRCLLDAQALIVPGSDDPGYTASKIYPYLLAGKPLLTVFHQNSSVVKLLQQVCGGIGVPFATGENPADIAPRIHAAWFAENQFEKMMPLDRTAFEPNTARYQAKVLAGFWEECLFKKRTN